MTSAHSGVSILVALRFNWDSSCQVFPLCSARALIYALPHGASSSSILCKFGGVNIKHWWQ